VLSAGLEFPKTGFATPCTTRGYSRLKQKWVSACLQGLPSAEADGHEIGFSLPLTSVNEELWHSTYTCLQTSGYPFKQNQIVP
jgi:hypothetical protein